MNEEKLNKCSGHNLPIHKMVSAFSPNYLSTVWQHMLRVKWEHCIGQRQRFIYWVELRAAIAVLLRLRITLATQIIRGIPLCILHHTPSQKKTSEQNIIIPDVAEKQDTRRDTTKTQIRNAIAKCWQTSCAPVQFSIMFVCVCVFFLVWPLFRVSRALNIGDTIANCLLVSVCECVCIHIFDIFKTCKYSTNI